MLIFLILAALALWTPEAVAVEFTCNVDLKSCNCMPPATSADCEAMKRNCADEINCKTKHGRCTCKLKPAIATEQPPSPQPPSPRDRPGVTLPPGAVAPQ